MTDDEYRPVAVSRRIYAPAHDIFQVLADPVRHPDFDGSQMLRGAGSAAVISGVGGSAGLPPQGRLMPVQPGEWKGCRA